MIGRRRFLTITAGALVAGLIVGLVEAFTAQHKLIILIRDGATSAQFPNGDASARIDRIRQEIERRLVTLNRELEDWQRKAELALSRDREDLAKGALVAKSKIAEQIEALQHQLVHIEEALAKSSEDISRLQEKLTDAKKREKAIVLRQKSAASRLKVNSQIHDDRINEAFARFEQVERNLDEMEGRVEAFDLGRKKTLAEEFSDLEASSKVEQELADLKARLHNSKPVAG